MHELSLIVDLLRKLDAIARAQHPAKVVAATIRLGALTHVSAPHLREHFVQACQGTALEGAHLVIEISADISDLHAQDMMLERVEVED
jgi:hydrogenase nickel incorporation protein HypA/HybF